MFLSATSWGFPVDFPKKTKILRHFSKSESILTPVLYTEGPAVDKDLFTRAAADICRPYISAKSSPFLSQQSIHSPLWQRTMHIFQAGDTSSTRQITGPESGELHKNSNDAWNGTCEAKTLWVSHKSFHLGSALANRLGLPVGNCQGIPMKHWDNGIIMG